MQQELLCLRNLFVISYLLYLRVVYQELKIPIAIICANTRARTFIRKRGRPPRQILKYVLIHAWTRNVWMIKRLDFGDLRPTDSVLNLVTEKGFILPIDRAHALMH